ncbi:MAG TPA: hypothetical protein VHC22_12785 [Pirellulales bacterium]|nr:hypothetical protein [Pirellulales bacterium]
MPRKSTQAQEQEPQGLDAEAPVAMREPGDDLDREPLPPQRGWKHNNAAGIEWLNYIDTEKKVYEFWLKFRDGRPSEAVRNYMKDNGFRWAGGAPSGGRWPDASGAWVRPIGYQTQAQDRLHGERVFDKVVDMILEEKGVVPEREPF